MLLRSSVGQGVHEITDAAILTATQLSTQTVRAAILMKVNSDALFLVSVLLEVSASLERANRSYHEEARFWG